MWATSGYLKRMPKTFEIVAKGEIPKHYLTERGILFFRKELDEWLTGRSRERDRQAFSSGSIPFRYAISTTIMRRGSAAVMEVKKKVGDRKARKMRLLGSCRTWIRTRTD
jgi:hypothetical protein